MKIEKEIIYNIVTAEGARLEVSEAELIELYKELGKIVISSTKFAPATVTVRKDFFHDQGEY